MDVSAAEATPGVVAVFTAADVPVNEYGLTDVRSAGAGRPRWHRPLEGGGRREPVEADQIAIVVAESQDAADAGAALVAVEWEDLPVVGDLDAA